MTYRKIKNFKKLSKEVKELKKQKKKIVLVLGHFNVIHPGHHRFLHFAKEQGETLIVAVLADKSLKDTGGRNFFQQEERARAVAALEVVDSVVILDEVDLSGLVTEIKPDIYVKGREFEHRVDSIKDEINIITENNGKVIFHSGEIRYSSTETFEHAASQIQQEKVQQLKEACRRHKINITDLKKQTQDFSKLNMLVIGDSIVDQFIACDALGMSSEAPVLTVKELEAREFIGGAAIIACHLKSLSAKSHFISVVGNDDPGRFVEKSLREQGVENTLFVDESRPTTFKIRYMVNNQKLLRVSRLQELSVSKTLEQKIIEELRRLVPQMNGIIVGDFVYGVITKNILNEITHLAKKHNVKLFGDLQCSSQVGNVSKFQKFDLITPTEREARIALSDTENGLEKIGQDLIATTDCRNLLITLAENGMVAYQKDEGENAFIASQFFPALVTNPVDVAGAGDSLLSAISLSLCNKNDLMPACVIGSCVAAISVNRVGNIPVTLRELDEYLHHLGKVVGKKGYEFS